MKCLREPCNVHFTTVKSPLERLEVEASKNSELIQEKLLYGDFKHIFAFAIKMRNWSKTFPWFPDFMNFRGS